MTNFISVCEGATGITKMTVMEATWEMSSLPPASDDGRRLTLRGLIWEPLMSTSMKEGMVTMQIHMRRKRHRKGMMDQRRRWRTEVGVGNVAGYECEDCDDADSDKEE
jgi:hypothetical protein